MTVTDRQPVADIQQVRLHALHLRDEGEEWIVGRVDTGRFVALPPVGVRAIELLREGISIAAATEKLSAEQGKPVEVASFVAALVRLGFVAEVDGVTVAGAKPTKSTFAWIKPSHVRWALHPAIWVGVALTMLAAIGVYVFHHGETIRSSDLLWSNRGSLVIVSLVALAWSTIFLHEIAHLITARAAGVPGRMSLGTRLQFLAAQTDVSGIWSAPRRTRMVVYLSGMAVNTVLASAGVLLASLCPPGAGRTFGAVLCISQLMLLSGQFMFFMRTDIYFVVQDLARCRDLYGDTTAYVRYLMRKVTGRSATGDPSLALPARERRAVRLYSTFFVPGTAITLLVFATVTLPVLVELIGGAVRHLAAADSVASAADALTVLLIIVLSESLWARVWWRRHGLQVKTLLQKIR